MTALYGSTAVPKRVFGEGHQLQVFESTMETMAPGAWELNKALKELWQQDALSHDWVLPDNFHVHVRVMETERHTVQFLNEPISIDIKVNKGTKEGRSLGPNLVHSVDGMVVREMVRRCSYNNETILGVLQDIKSTKTRTSEDDDQMVITLWNHYQESGFLSARILDHLNHWNMGHVDPDHIIELIKILPLKSFQLMTIHQWWM